MKRCAPFLQALTAGYFIPVPFDVPFTNSPQGELSWIGDPAMFRRHTPSQQIDTPFAAANIIKFYNPWLIKTPPGYSTLFIRPFNRFDCPFIPLTGLVETDTYYDAVQFPAVCQMPPGTTYTLTRGSPFVQVIPILRESWTSVVKLADAALVQKTATAVAANPHLYKEVHWRKIDYG